MENDEVSADDKFDYELNWLKGKNKLRIKLLQDVFFTWIYRNGSLLMDESFHKELAHSFYR